MRPIRAEEDGIYCCYLLGSPYFSEFLKSSVGFCVDELSYEETRTHPYMVVLFEKDGNGGVGNIYFRHFFDNFEDADDAFVVEANNMGLFTECISIGRNSLIKGRLFDTKLVYQKSEREVLSSIVPIGGSKPLMED